MKTLSLVHSSLKVSELLEKEQLKHVFGGSDVVSSGGCIITCNDGSQSEAGSCARSEAEEACKAHQGPASCAGEAGECNA